MDSFFICIIWNRNTSGKKHKRFREILETKKEILVFDLGDNFNQKQFSLLEQKEEFDEDLCKTTVYNFSKEKRKKKKAKNSLWKILKSKFMMKNTTCKVEIDTLP